MMRINSILTNAKSCANILLININRIMTQMSTPDKAEIADIKLIRMLNNELAFVNLEFPEVESVIFISADNRICRIIYNKDSNEFTLEFIFISKESLKTLPLGLVYFVGQFSTE